MRGENLAILHQYYGIGAVNYHTGECVVQFHGSLLSKCCGALFGVILTGSEPGWLEGEVDPAVTSIGPFLLGFRTTHHSTNLASATRLTSCEDDPLSISVYIRATLAESQQRLINNLCVASSPLRTLYELVQSFGDLVRRREGWRLSEWQQAV